MPMAVDPSGNHPQLMRLAAFRHGSAPAGAVTSPDWTKILTSWHGESRLPSNSRKLVSGSGCSGISARSSRGAKAEPANVPTTAPMLPIIYRREMSASVRGVMASVAWPGHSQKRSTPVRATGSTQARHLHGPLSRHPRAWRSWAIGLGRVMPTTRCWQDNAAP